MGELTIAKSAGFCFGVTRAVNMVYEAIEKENVPIYTYGPIIHNDEVVKDMEKNGVTVINDLDELSSHEKGVMIIRSHGISKAEYDRIKNCGFEVLNATCPFVSKIHRYVEDYSSKGYDIIIVGSPKHPEVCGIKGWADEKCHVTIINAPEDAENYMKNSTKKLCIVSQTTFNYNKFQDIVEIIAKKGYDITVLNTICNATEVRQTEARKVAQCSDVMIVIGDRHSSNTQKLFEICKNECKNTYYIQTSDEMDYTQIRSNNNVGITAGASPQIISLRRFQRMSEMSFEQMLEESFKTIRNGEVVEGTVIDVKPDEIFLNIGYKSDGIITRNEYTNEPNVDLTTVVKVGDKMEAKVVKLNDGEGQVILSYKRLQAEKGSKRLEEAFENQEVLKAKVTQVLAGGVCVSVDETRVFIPASLVSDTYEKDLNKFKDQEIEFIITEFDPRKRRIIGNRKVLLVEQKAKQQEELLANLHVGDVIEGTVKNVTDFGAFIDLGGVDGLLHISEMSWGRVENPKKVFTVGQTVRVFVKNINGSKIALSMKFDDENPWNGATEKFAPGNIVKGKVARMTDFGAFIELAPGVDALLHVSQISKDHVEKPSDVLKIGQEVEAKVVEFNEDDKKISLSMKALLDSEDDGADVADVNIDEVASDNE